MTTMTGPISMRKFPTDLLPPAVAKFVCASAAASRTDPAMTAIPTLAVMAAAIGTKRGVELKTSWVELPILWTATIARSGANKTCCFDRAVKPLLDVQNLELADYDREKAEYDMAVGEYNRAKPRDRDHLTKPTLQPPRRRVLSEVTLEAVAAVLADNEQGLLVARDELAGWIKGFDAYKGVRGADVAGWLELHRGGFLVVDRKGGDRKTIHVRRAAVSVVGTTQPGTFRNLMTDQYFESGLSARLIVAAPAAAPKRWDDADVSEVVYGEYAGVIDNLLSLQPASGDCGPDPVLLRLSDDAKNAWAAWYDANACRQAQSVTDREASVWAKIEAAGARIALIFELANNPSATTVSEDSIIRGTTMAEWLGVETLRVHNQFHESDEARDVRKAIELIQNRGGEVAVREWQRIKTLPTAADARAELAILEEMQLGLFYFDKPDRSGGRPSEVFRLASYGDSDNTSTDGIAA